MSARSIIIDITIRKTCSLSLFQRRTLRLHIRRAIRAAVGELSRAKNFEVSVILTDEQEMRALNHKYRGKDSVTDVLSFPLQDNLNQESVHNPDLKSAATDLPPEKHAPPDAHAHIPLGDIVVCLPRAEQQAKDARHPLKRELMFLCVHSVLHLFGYDHEKDKPSAAKMFAMQAEIMKGLSL
ncbi:MAG: rRNA maturation RNase YbeY [Clostridiales bacterium]|jgi:rRNA maturation RNase YbeY|nr:rRNA maturation RNase YbeY [Clostridiales bacterium]